MLGCRFPRPPVVGLSGCRAPVRPLSGGPNTGDVQFSSGPLEDNMCRSDTDLNVVRSVGSRKQTAVPETPRLTGSKSWRPGSSGEKGGTTYPYRTKGPSCVPSHHQSSALTGPKFRVRRLRIGTVEALVFVGGECANESRSWARGGKTRRRIVKIVEKRQPVITVTCPLMSLCVFVDLH